MYSKNLLKYHCVHVQLKAYFEENWDLTATNFSG